MIPLESSDLSSSDEENQPSKHEQTTGLANNGRIRHKTKRQGTDSSCTETDSSYLPASMAPEPFDGKTDVELWVDRFELYAKMKKYTETKKMDCMNLLLREKAQEWLSNNRKTIKTYKQMKDGLIARFTPNKVNQWSLRHEFNDAKQAADETVEDYFQRVTRLGRNLGQTTDRIMEVITMNSLPRISEHLMLNEPTDLDDCLNKAVLASILYNKTTDTS